MWKGGQGKEMEEIWKCREKVREWKGWEKYEWDETTSEGWEEKQIRLHNPSIKQYNKTPEIYHNAKGEHSVW